MTEERVKELEAKLDIIQQNCAALIDQKAELEEANKRLARAVAELTIEKHELEQKLKSLDGLGIHQNTPDTFAILKADAGKSS